MGLARRAQLEPKLLQHTILQLSDLERGVDHPGYAMTSGRYRQLL